MHTDTSKTSTLLNFLRDEVLDILSLKEDDAKPPNRLAERVLQSPRLAKKLTGFLVSSQEDAQKLGELKSQIEAALIDLSEGETAAAISILQAWSMGLETGSRHEFPTTTEQVYIWAAYAAGCTRCDIEQVLLELAQRAERGSFKNFPGPPASPIPTRHLTDPPKKTP